MRHLIAAIELTALLVALVVVANVHVVAALWLSLFILAVALVALVFGWRPPRIRSRGKALMVVIISLASFGAIAPILKAQQDAELAQLRSSDIDGYLARLKGVDEKRWLAELGKLRPDDYKAELARQKAVAAAQRLAQCTDKKAGEAYVMIQSDVLRQLRAPSTAKFPSRYGAGTRHIGDCVYQVFGQFDAQNGFGAMLRGGVSGTIRHFPESGSWQTQKLDVQG
ncbi:hypothetical protein [Rhodovulum kholense]|uniref:Uncharacterized protein n=1 Tax=Rhodovulum kholense TaxID=453584 RepID=A0A8E2VKQ6_9RHOB|nr:hypothetical protein [Rhodovulum kholense]PTW50581.1 hypothetical protein C8N38_104217 [Rhodovulum kholense]